MPYSAEIVGRARARLESEQADRESMEQARLAEAYEAQPRLREIDRLLRLNMATAAKAVFTRENQEALAQAKAENMALQQERRRLVETCFAPGYLEETPACGVCGGTGYLGTQMCSCLRELCRQEQAKEVALLSTEEECFENFCASYYSDVTDSRYGASPRRIMEQNYRICRKYAESFGQGSGNLLFVGGTGLGKTFLSACIARVVAENGFSVTYETASHLFSKLEKDRFSPDDQSREDTLRMENCDLLIIDDLGTELPGAFVTAALYTLINDRLLSGRSTVISTNLTAQEITERYSPQIGSRLQGSYRRLTFVGEDVRILKSRGVPV